ncbi:DUF3052 domain-containing protein [Rhizobium leguminosarum]|uniref:DUF3052 domain-containing protein n=1 Tax=Rhizobium leguminosarum TaxID=384 RepID=A0A4Q8Y149_RHILE|nr:DUF3052 domain-containing protein [Rhizobium leguminosarum]TAV90549.1 DUF3052 domain-containing protein [Rhizobium leguminosarum]TAV95154.1 DUF3052 domain-containing protein [Rhizobium leguminosarum]TAW36233.1 DUF3052 domain-containing protein [Rhizobium leguminosarum]TAX31072.1 DUF3052 domain-containing protein [Rhizobium leguminosarum]TAX56673.1 DUF3052 domain-containing protein [Rhizobium leguminosarum]
MRGEERPQADDTAAPKAAGYSGTPLVKKLGLTRGQAAALLNVPETIGDINGFDGFASVVRALPETPARVFDYVHLFTTERTVLERTAPVLLPVLVPNGMVWISWPKKSSRVPTDITEDVLREVLLPTGLVDVKVCAVDEIWSGLKFVIRKELRGAL